MASNRLRGITIQIGAETTELNNAMRDINTQAGSLQHELIEVNRLLRVDPGNVELLAQQQALYSDQLDNSRERLQMLRQAEADLQEQFRRGDASEEQMRSLNREIIRTEQGIQRTEQAMQGLNGSTQETGESASELGEKFTTGLKAATAAGVAAVDALGVASIKAADDMTNALNQYRAATGAAAESMGDIEGAVKRIYNNNLGENFDDIAQSMALVQQQTHLTGGALEDATSYALLMRDTFDLDVNEGIRGANALMQKFGISAEEAYNLIAVGAQNGLNQNQDLADQLAEYSVYYADMGFSADEMFDIMASGAANGAFQIDYLNDAVKEFGIQTKDNSEGTRAAFEALGFDADALTEAFAAGGDQAKEAFETITYELLDMPDKIKQNEIGVALFGTKWEDVGVAGMEALMDVQDSIDTTKDALSEINAIKYDSFGEAIQGVGRQVQTDLLMPIGDALLPALNTFANLLQLLITHFDVIGPILAGVAATVVTFTVATNAHTIATKAQTAATQMAQLAMQLFNGTLKANQIGLVVAAIMGLVTVFGILWTTNEDFRNSMLELWADLKGFLVQTLDNFRALFASTWDAIKLIFDSFAKLFRGDFSGFLSGLIQLITQAIPNMLAAGRNLFTGMWDGMKEVWTNLQTWVSDKVSWLADKLAFWRSSQAEMGGGSDGSHAKGLNYVPFDGYRAILHEGEAVLTKTEAREYRNGGARSGGDINVTQHIYSPTPDPRVEQRQAAREFKRIGVLLS